MKKNISFAVSVMILAATFTSCGNVKENLETAESVSNTAVSTAISDNSSLTTTVSETTVSCAATDTTNYSTTSEDNSAGYTSYAISSSNTDYEFVAANLAFELNKIDLWGGCAVKCDYNDYFCESEGLNYYKITAEDFSFCSVAEIRQYLDELLTGNTRNYYSYLTSGESCVFKEHNKNMYIFEGARGAGFPYLMTARGYAIDLQNVSDNSFEFDIMCEENMVSPITNIHIWVVAENGLWKITDFRCDLGNPADSEFESSGLLDEGENFIGKWGHDRAFIDVTYGPAPGRYNVYIHWATSASENNEWFYECTYSKDTGGLISDSSKYIKSVYFDDGSDPEFEESDAGHSLFTLESDGIHWDDQKEDNGAGIVFEKIG